MSSSRPKPWEVSSGTSGASVGLNTTGSTQTQQVAQSSHMNTSSDNSDNAPALPEKPQTLRNASTDMNTNTNNPSAPDSYGTGYNNNPGYGSGIGSYGSYGSYGSGMYGSGMYGSGMYGSGMYGSGLGMYGSGLGMGGGMFGGNNFAGSLAQGTETTFQLIESFIGAVTGFAQMLESTYYATHNSFFTMMSVAEQFSHLKDALGSLLGIYAVMGWIKKLLRRLKGSKTRFSIDEFKKYQKRIEQSGLNRNNKSISNGSNDNNKNGRGSLKPLLFFLAAVFGMPYLLKKLVTTVARQQQQRVLQRRQQQQQQQNQQGIAARNGNLIGNALEILDPKKLEFARVMYNFNPENEQMELGLKKGDLVAILSKSGPNGEPSNWWRCRSRDGRLGFVPYNYLEVIKRVRNGEKVVSAEKSDDSLKTGLKKQATE
ncbi:hypothetical protein FOA43_002724 [Brettanomyces nanus]|uniref:Peroxisomal membrane protein PEX13 n=1 Tax=Eeniella nana TaxID=13502 RepID=A0A875S0T4_EENNA|nr:uncharacterized protein FOA43_002724 [Brettanomyces nanus]QPG75371.1 hypothetical protein FOA43_002724 [Brettanomyces nanus]